MQSTIDFDDLVASLSSTCVLVPQASELATLHAQLAQSLFQQSTAAAAATTTAPAGYAPANTPTATTSAAGSWSEDVRRRSPSLTRGASRARKGSDARIMIEEEMDEDEQEVYAQLMMPPPPSSAPATQPHFFGNPSNPPNSPQRQYSAAAPLPYHSSATHQQQQQQQQQQHQTGRYPEAYQHSQTAYYDPASSTFATHDPFYLAQLNAAAAQQSASSFFQLQTSQQHQPPAAYYGPPVTLPLAIDTRPRFAVSQNDRMAWR